MRQLSVYISQNIYDSHKLSHLWYPASLSVYFCFIYLVSVLFSDYLWYITSDVQKERITIVLHRRLTSAYGHESAHNNGDDDSADTEVTIRDVVQRFSICPAKTQWLIYFQGNFFVKITKKTNTNS